MKKIILSVAVATMALSTAAAALEDIKVNGQAKLWYETNNVGPVNDLFNKTNSSGEVVFKIGMTGKQGNVGFGATVYQTSSMGLEKTLVSTVRTNDSGLTGVGTDDGEMYTGEMYITAPVGAKTLLKIGKQELDTPLTFTERWNATPNTFNAAVAINNSINDLTLIGAYVGQGSRGEVTGAAYANTSVYAAGGLYKNDALALNVWAYNLNSTAMAYWIDASMKVGPAKIKAYAALMDAETAAAGIDTTTKAFALSASAKVAGINLFAAASDVSDDGALAVGNVATGYKKTKLPTAGVYTDGKYVAQPGSTAFKIKASGKLGTTGIALQVIDNSNSSVAANGSASGGSTGYATNADLETTEVDLIISQKLGDFNLKAILMDRSFDVAATDSAKGGQHVRVIASVNF